MQQKNKGINFLSCFNTVLRENIIYFQFGRSAPFVEFT